MTLASDDRYQLVQPVVSTSAFTLDFPIFSLTDDVEVYIDGVLTSAYALTGTASNGKISSATLTLDEAIVNQDLEIIGARTPRRDEDLVAGSEVIANINADKDVRAAENQELRRDLDWAVRLPVGSAVNAGVLGTLTAGYLLAVNAAGTGITQTALPSLSSQPFPTVAQIAAGDYTANTVLICTGHTTPGDGGHSLWTKAGSEPSHDMKKQDTAGNWFEYSPGPEGVSAQAAGFLEANSGTDNKTAADAWTSYINASDFKKGVCADGSYTINGAISLDTAKAMLSGYGVNLIQEATSGPLIDLNSTATSDETNGTSYIVLEGFHLTHTTNYATTANACVGIRARDITRLRISDIQVQQMHVGMEFNPRDECLVERFNCFQNDTHILVDDWQTSGANPQDVMFVSCGLSAHYSYGVRITGNCNNFKYEGGYNIGSRAFVVENGSTSATVPNNNGLHIRNVDMEQGAVVALTGSWTLGTGSATITGTSGDATNELTAKDRIATPGGYTYTVDSITDANTIVLTANPEAAESAVTIYRADPYIDIRDTNNEVMRNVVVSSCKFSAFSNVGAGTGMHLLHARSTIGISVADNEMSSRAPGYIWLDADCEEIDLGRSAYTGTDNQIHFDCDREEIRVWPYQITLPFNTGIINNGAAVSDDYSTGETEVDLPSLVSAAYWPIECPPLAVEMVMHAQDSGSSGASPLAEFVTDASTNASHGPRFCRVDLNGTTNDEWKSGYGRVVCDAEGKIRRRVTASGSGTLRLRAKAQALIT